MKPLTADFNAAELGRRHALLGMRCAGVVYAVIDQVEYEKAYAAAIADAHAPSTSDELAKGSAAG